MPIDSSKFFDSIRIKPNKLSAKQQAQAREESAMCEWPDCKNKGPHRAPKGRANDKEYWHFCLNHVREYNQSYNFFSGMNADAVARYQKDALTGHRPTWKMGANTSAKKGKGSPEADLEGASDPFSMFSELNGRGRWRPGPGGAAGETKVETRKIFNAERKALQVMGLGSDATLETVKAKYKALVKQHHPDANGGDRSTEDRLIEIIKAYNYLKTVVRGAGSAHFHRSAVHFANAGLRRAGRRPPARSRRRHAGGGSSRSPARRSARRRPPPASSNAWRSRRDAEIRHIRAARTPPARPAAHGPAPTAGSPGY